MLSSASAITFNGISMKFCHMVKCLRGVTCHDETLSILINVGKFIALFISRGLYFHILLYSEFVCLEFYAVSTVLQIRVSWTIVNQYLTSPLSLHSWASRSAIPIILSARVKVNTTSFKDFGLSRPGIEPTTSRSRGGCSNH